MKMAELKGIVYTTHNVNANEPMQARSPASDNKGKRSHGLAGTKKLGKIAKTAVTQSLFNLWVHSLPMNVMTDCPLPVNSKIFSRFKRIMENSTTLRISHKQLSVIRYQ